MMPAMILIEGAMRTDHVGYAGSAAQVSGNQPVKQVQGMNVYYVVIRDVASQPACHSPRTPEARRPISAEEAHLNTFIRGATLASGTDTLRWVPGQPGPRLVKVGAADRHLEALPHQCPSEAQNVAGATGAWRKTG